jgi:hypothetical protein
MQMESTNYSIVDSAMTADKFIVTLQKIKYLHVMRNMIQCGLLLRVATECYVISTISCQGNCRSQSLGLLNYPPAFVHACGMAETQI